MNRNFNVNEIQIVTKYRFFLQKFRSFDVELHMKQSVLKNEKSKPIYAMIYSNVLNPIRQMLSTMLISKNNPLTPIARRGGGNGGGTNDGGYIWVG